MHGKQNAEILKRIYPMHTAYPHEHTFTLYVRALISFAADRHAQAGKQAAPSDGHACQRSPAS